jgi:ABC-type Zn uptake system ZnuABC Zn-binding protein ZnuA
MWAVAAALLGWCLIGLGCDSRQPAPGPHKIRIVATIPPLGGLVKALLENQKIDHDLTTLLPPGASEHGFELTPDNLKALATADIVVMVGLGMEPQVDKFLKDHPRPAAERRVIVMADIPSIHSEIRQDHDDDDEVGGHDHADHHDDKADAAHDHHDHSGGDPHLWLDPKLVQPLIFEISDAIESRLGSDISAKTLLKRASTTLVQDVSQVGTNYRFTLKDAPRHTIVVGHDAYGYLARRYDLEVVAISGLNAGEPRPDDLKKAADAVREKHLTTIFIEPQLSSAAAERLAQATGAKTAGLDPLGDGDWFKLMEKNLAALKDALGAPDVRLPVPHTPAPATTPVPTKKP